jgi:hypothetical protein
MHQPLPASAASQQAAHTPAAAAAAAAAAQPQEVLWDAHHPLVPAHTLSQVSPPPPLLLLVGTPQSCQGGCLWVALAAKQVEALQALLWTEQCRADLLLVEGAAG